MKNQLKKIPLLGPLGRKTAKTLRNTGRRLRGKPGEHAPYDFTRMDLTAENKFDVPTRKIVNLLNYTKTSFQTYNGGIFPAGYHSLSMDGIDLPGQRNPAERINLMPIDFSGKTVLDIGSNQGGMLFSIAKDIKHGVGIDYDSRLVNAANKIRSHTDSQNLDFFVFDLENEDLELIRDFLPVEKVDVTFFLAVSMWIKNWKSVIDLAAKISEQVVFESNGKNEEQDDQVAYLRKRFSVVEQISEQSGDDTIQRNRKLYICH